MFLDRDGGCVRENRDGMYCSSVDIAHLFLDHVGP